MERFQAIREFALSLSSIDDARARLVDAIDVMSAVHDAYVDVSIAKDDALTTLQATIAAARVKQNEVEEQLHHCQIRADDNLAQIPDEFNPSQIKFLPMDESEFPDDMSEEERIRFRLEHDFEEMPKLKQIQADLDDRRHQLKKELEETRAVYGSILNKMNQMYEQLLSFAQKK